MKRLICIILATLFSLMIICASVNIVAGCEDNWTTVNVQLDTRLDGQAVFTSEKNHTALYSAKLVIPANAQAGSAAYALYEYNKSLNSIDSLSFYVAYTQALPRIFIALDKNNDTVIDSILLSNYKNASNGEWKSISADYCNGWTESDYAMSNYGANWTSFSYWKTLYGNATVQFAGVCLEYWAVEPDGFGQAIYTDKMILNGVYHTIEPVTSPDPTPTPTNTAYPNATETPTPTPQPKVTPTLNLTCSSFLDDDKLTVEIKGVLTGNGTAIPGAPIKILYSLSGGATWNELTFVNTQEDGSFSALWFPTVTGNFLVKALFNEDAQYATVKTVVNLAVMPTDEDENLFSVSSNSTLSQLAFNSETNELSFKVTGDNGTSGYTDVFIPKTLIADISGLKAYLDGQQINYTTTELAEAWVLHFAYHHSEHIVTLTFDGLTEAATMHGNEESSTNWPVYLTLLAVALSSVAVIALMLKRSVTKKNR
ncbi:MAG: hypothetical protein ACQCN4_03095 [Candidatus Bathyarchaeia archaeon]